MTDRKELNEAFLAAGSRVIAAYEAEDLETLMQATMDCMDIFTQVAKDAAREIDVAVAQRDALQAEVVQLRACLPKWRKVPWIENRWELHMVDKHNVVCVNSRGWWHRHQSEHTPEYESRDAAMRAAEAWLGLPQCEVCDEP